MPPSLLGLTRWALLCCAGSPERERRGRAKVQLLKKITNTVAYPCTVPSQSKTIGVFADVLQLERHGTRGPVVYERLQPNTTGPVVICKAQPPRPPNKGPTVQLATNALLLSTYCNIAI